MKSNNFMAELAMAICGLDPTEELTLPEARHLVQIEATTDDKLAYIDRMLTLGRITEEMTDTLRREIS